jgi:epsilon-lactone hydrolase
VAAAQAAPTRGARTVPARTLPVPTTVGPQAAALIGAPLAAGGDTVPTDAAGWRALAAQSAEDPGSPR